jgi:hypothetical protein
VPIFKNHNKTVKNAQYSLQATSAIHVIYLTITLKKRKYIIVMDAVYVELEAKKNHSIVINVNVALI